MSVRRSCYDSMYPFGLMSVAGFARADFAPVTIFSGGNGAGKSTALNIIAEKLKLQRSAAFNRSPFFPDYLKLCGAGVEEKIPPESAFIASDDVFDYMLDVRNANEGIDREREGLFGDYYRARQRGLRVRSLADYDELKKQNSARGKTQSAFVRERLPETIPEKSNGESALFYFDQRLKTDALYLLDEPENSLSAKKQIELGALLENCARYLGCQLIISTHSPFLLALPGAKIYDMDTRPVRARKWTELENPRAYYDFFRARGGDFEAAEDDD